MKKPQPFYFSLDCQANLQKIYKWLSIAVSIKGQVIEIVRQFLWGKMSGLNSRTFWAGGTKNIELEKSLQYIGTVLVSRICNK